MFRGGGLSFGGVQYVVWVNDENLEIADETRMMRNIDVAELELTGSKKTK